MQVKQMREYLKDKVETVPRSNTDVELLYRKMSGTEASNEPNLPDAGDIYTYIGYGDTPPHTIKFMGIQHFIRGVATKVTDPRVLAKIGGNRSFVKGEADMDKVFAEDELWAKRVQKQREEDVKTQIAIERQNRKS